MKKKTRTKNISYSRNPSVFHYLLVIVPLVLLFLSVIMTHKSRSESKVLGTTTEPIFLAKGGDDGGSSGGGDHGSSGGGGSSGGNTSGNSGGGSGGSSGSSLSQPKPRVVEQKKEKIEKLEVAKPEVKKSTTETKTPDRLEVKTEDNKTRIDIRKAGTRVRVKIEGNKTVIKVKQENKNEVELEEHDALEKVNEALKENGVEIHKTEQNAIAIRNGEVEAETHLPLSIDPQTHELTVETEAGVKKVAVLPEQAIQNILSKKVITSVQSKTTVNPQNKTEHVQKAELTELNGEAVFRIQGVSNKKFLGIFDLVLPKTLLTSAETGEIRKIDETFMSRILELISF